MTERLVADAGTTRMINWVLGVGAVVTGALLVWIGSQTQALAVNTAVMKTEVSMIADKVNQNGESISGVRREVRENTTAIDRLSNRVATIEHAGTDR